MWPPADDATPPPPPRFGGGGGGPGLPGAAPTAGGEPPRRPWLRWAAIALGVVTAALVILAIVLVTRSPGPPTPVARGTPTASPSPSATPLPTPTPTPSPTPTAQPTATAVPPPNTPTQQANILFPPTGTECGAQGDYSGCPVTTTLIGNATRWRPAHPGNPEPLCRCQSTYPATVAVEDRNSIPAGDRGNPNIDAVDVSLALTPSGSETMVVLFARQSNGTWLAYDTYCDNPQNRLSAAAPTPC